MLHIFFPWSHWLNLAKLCKRPWSSWHDLLLLLSKWSMLFSLSWEVSPAGHWLIAIMMLKQCFQIPLHNPALKNFTDDSIGTQVSNWTIMPLYWQNTKPLSASISMHCRTTDFWQHSTVNLWWYSAYVEGMPVLDGMFWLWTACQACVMPTNRHRAHRASYVLYRAPIPAPLPLTYPHPPKHNVSSMLWKITRVGQHVPMMHMGAHTWQRRHVWASASHILLCWMGEM